MADPWWSSYGADLAPYAILLRLLIDDQVGGEEFETIFLALFANESAVRPQNVFNVLDRSFADVDDFVLSDELRAEVRGIDESELRRRAEIALRELAECAR